MNTRQYLTVFLVALMAAPAASQARFDSAYLEPSYIEPGDDVNVYVKFHEGTVKRDLYVTQTKQDEKLPIGEKSDTYYVARITPKDSATKQYILIKENERNIGHLFTGETWTAPFEIYVSDNAPPTTYTLDFQLLKTDLSGEKKREVVLSHEISVEVKGVPDFTIKTDSMLTSGETGQFKISIGNVGGGVARSVNVNLNATFPLTVLKSSNMHVGDMSGKTSSSVVYDLHVDSSAAPKAYTMPFEISYIDRSGTCQRVVKNIGVKVSGMPVVTANLDGQEDFASGIEGSITVSVVNKGFVDANFLSLSVVDTKDYEVTSNREVYIGNLASDDFETEDFNIKLADGVSDDIPIKLKVTYTEENNNEMHVEDLNLDLHVLSDSEYYMKHPKSNGSQQLMTALMVIPALLVGYLILWLLFKIMGLITGFIDRKVFRRS